jgi:hypothetical protein
MHILGVPGLVALAIGLFLGLWLSAEKLITGAAIGGRPLLLLSVLLVLVGVQFFGLGLLGELLVHGSHERESRLPVTVLRESVGLDYERIDGSGTHVGN